MISGFLSRLVGQTAMSAKAPAVSAAPRRRRRLVIYLAVSIAIIASIYSAHTLRTFRETQRYAARIQSLLAKNRLELAVMVADEWIRRKPSSAEAYAWRCRAQWMRFQFAEASRDLEKAKSLGWPDEVSDLEMLLIRAKAGQFNEVEPLLRAVFLSKATSEPELDAALAKGYIERYQFDQAMICLEHWLNLTPNDARPYRWRAEIYERLPDRTADALNDYLKVIALDPSHYDAQLKAAQLFLALSRPDDAAQHYARCLELRPGNVDSLCGLAECKVAERKQHEATALLDQALLIQPRHPQALVLRARIDLMENRAEAAIARLKLAIQHDPLNQVAYYALNLALTSLGDASGAEEARRAHKRIGQVLERLQELRVAVLDSPKDVAILEEIVRLFQEHGHSEDAGRWARILLELDPQNHVAQQASTRSDGTSNVP